MNLITEAFADTAQVATNAAPAQSTTQSLMSILPMIVLLVLFMYFMVIRPQSKRAKEHKNLVGNLQKGDEVITAVSYRYTKAELEKLLQENFQNYNIFFSSDAKTAAAICQQPIY